MHLHFDFLLMGLFNPFSLNLVRTFPDDLVLKLYRLFQFFFLRGSHFVSKLTGGQTNSRIINANVHSLLERTRKLKRYSFV